jgi:hypothetical protein
MVDTLHQLLKIYNTSLIYIRVINILLVTMEVQLGAKLQHLKEQQLLQQWEEQLCLHLLNLWEVLTYGQVTRDYIIYLEKME